jgi:hypothetical protein
MGSKQRRQAAHDFNAQSHSTHAMLVSRCASHMASALQPEHRDEALAEGIAAAIAHGGHARLGLFLAAVWHWLDERRYHEAADTVQSFIENGAISEQQRAPRSPGGRGAHIRRLT